MYNLQDFVLFAAVAHARNYSRASEQLGIPNSTLSRRIKTLEKSVGLQLLNRTTRKIELTEAGTQFFQRCQHIIAEADLAHNELLQRRLRPTGDIRLSMPVDLGCVYLAPALAAFVEQYPEIQLDIDLSHRNLDMSDEKLDIIFRIGDLPNSSLIARHLLSIPFALYASPSYLRHSPSVKIPQHLNAHRCIHLGNNKSWTLKKANHLRSITCDSAIRLNNIGMAHKLAQNGAGVASLPTLIAAPSLQDKSLQRILPFWSLPPVEVHMITTSRLLPARIRLLMHFVQDFLSNAQKT